MTLYERDWQNICKNKRKIEKAIYDCLNVNRKRFTFDGHLFNLEVKEWNCLKS